ncbi:MAG: DUF302 domain-containing protein [Alphaproteobacteria bacterium]
MPDDRRGSGVTTAFGDALAALDERTKPALGQAPMSRLARRVRLLTAALLLWQAQPAVADPADYPYEGIVEIATPHDFDALWDRLAAAIEAHDMLLVAAASASRGAAGRGVAIPGNGIVEVFRNDFAVRMLAANIPAGMEAPIRFYLTDNGDGTASLTYRRPSAVFAPYGGEALDVMAGELDAIFAAIAADAAGTGPVGASP